jgi:hypothetical protein
MSVGVKITVFDVFTVASVVAVVFNKKSVLGATPLSSVVVK